MKLPKLRSTANMLFGVSEKLSGMHWAIYKLYYKNQSYKNKVEISQNNPRKMKKKNPGCKVTIDGT